MKATRDSVGAAAYRFRESIVDLADRFGGPAPVWRGWALHEAFKAGAEWQARRKSQKKPKIPLANE